VATDFFIGDKTEKTEKIREPIYNYNYVVGTKLECF
jgi:hypothetical protein